MKAGYPPNTIPASISTGNVAAAIATCTLPAKPNKFLHLCGFEITASGATTGLAVIATVAGCVGGTLSYIFTFPAGVLVTATPLLVTFDPPLVALTPGTTIVVTLPSGGSGNTNAAISAHGYYGDQPWPLT